jgi:c(7)-type cytochrome triheme protein
MRTLIASFAAIAVLLGAGMLYSAPKAPEKLVFKAKTGDVAYDHAAHVKREKNDCKVCHDKLFKQLATAPLNFKAGMHKPAEASKASCGACHRAGGTAFETKGNCKKCHGTAKG